MIYPHRRKKEMERSRRNRQYFRNHDMAVRTTAITYLQTAWNNKMEPRNQASNQAASLANDTNRIIDPKIETGPPAQPRPFGRPRFAPYLRNTCWLYPPVSMLSSFVTSGRVLLLLGRYSSHAIPNLPGYIRPKCRPDLHLDCYLSVLTAEVMSCKTVTQSTGWDGCDYLGWNHTFT